MRASWIHPRISWITPRIAGSACRSRRTRAAGRSRHAGLLELDGWQRHGTQAGCRRCRGTARCRRGRTCGSRRRDGRLLRRRGRGLPAFQVRLQRRIDGRLLLYLLAKPRGLGACARGRGGGLGFGGLVGGLAVVVVGAELLCGGKPALGFGQCLGRRRGGTRATRRADFRLRPIHHLDRRRHGGAASQSGGKAHQPQQGEVMDFSACACHKHHSGERIGALSAYHFAFATPQRPAGLRDRESMMDIGYFLKLMMDRGASDMFLSTGTPVHIKIEGRLAALGTSPLPSGMVKKIAYSLMDEGSVPKFERELEYNMALAVKDVGRFRVNVFKQRGEVALVIRAIKSDIPSIEELLLPPIYKKLIMEPRGLILVVGATGSGKSTT